MISEIQNLAHIFGVYYFHNKFAVSISPGMIGAGFLDILAGHCYPISVWRKGDISNGECASRDDFFEGIRFQRVFAYSAIFAAGYEEIVLLKVSLREEQVVDNRTAAATAVFESWQLSIVVGSASDPVWKTRIALFSPTVTSLVPSGV